MDPARVPPPTPAPPVVPWALIDALPSVVFTVDPAAPGVVTFISPAVDDLLGYPACEIVGRPDVLGAILETETSRAALQRTKQWLAAGAAETLVSRLSVRARDGRWLWIDIRLRAVRDEAGTILWLAGTAADVTTDVETTERLHHLSEQVPGVLYQCRLRPDGVIEFPFVSDSAWRLYGVDPAIGHDDGARIFDRVHRDDLERVRTTTLASARDLTPWQCDFRLAHPDGSFVWVAGQSTPERQADGSVLWHGYLTDITARKAAEIALAASDELLQAVAAVNLEIARATRVDDDLERAFGRLGRAVDVDRVYLFDVRRSDEGATIGRQRVEWAREAALAEMDNPALQHFDFDAAGVGRWADALHAGRPVQGVVDLLPPGEQPVLSAQHIQALLVLPVMIEGTLAAFVGFDDCRRAREWTPNEVASLQLVASAVGERLERERLKEATARAEATTAAEQRRVQKLTAHAPGLIYQFRLRPDGTTELPYASAGFDEVFGGAAAPDADGAVVFSRVHPEDLELVQRTIAGSAATLSHWTCRFRVQHPRKGLIWVEGHSAPEREDDGSTLWHGYATDITPRVTAEAERIELERRLLHAQKLESLGVLAGGIAHDFNNLLMAVLGNLELALLDLPPAGPARQGVQEAVGAAQRAADLTRQMLAYSGRGVFVVRPTDLNALVEENVHLLRAIVPRTVSLELMLTPGLPAVVADAGQLQQVVMNLITNAAEALGDDPGRVVLSTGFDRFDAQALAGNLLGVPAAPGAYVWFAVRDTGCGMTPEVLARLFEPFFSTKFTGRGLGMPAVQGIVKAHGGALLIDTRPGAGSLVKVLLPGGASGPSDEAVADRSAGAASPAAATILVVDDEAPVRRLLELTLRREGYQTRLAGDGAEALAIFEANPEAIDLVLLDLTMPTMDGRTTLAALRALAPDLPVILSSGFGEQEVSRRFPGEGPTAFLQKPFRREALLDIVARTLARPV